MKRLVILTSAALCLFIAAAAMAAVPQQVNYQGLLKTAGGAPVPNGSYPVVFSIYATPTGGTALWTESKSVTTTSGSFSTYLGSVTPIPNSALAGDAGYLGIKVSSDPEMTPRIALASVPFSRYSSEISGDIETGPGTFSLSNKAAPPPKKHEMRMAMDSTKGSLLLLGANGLDTLFSVYGSSTGNLGKSASDPFAANLNLSKSNINRIHFLSGGDNIGSSMAYVDSVGDTTFSVSATASKTTVKSSKSNSNERFQLQNDSVGSSMVFVGANGDTLYSVSGTGTSSKSSADAFAANLNLSKSNINRIHFLSGGTGSSMTIVDSLGATKVLITDTMSSLRGITANGVTKIATGGRVQSEVSGGARILGEQGNTPARPAIGLFATNGVDDGGGGNGIYRPASNVMAFATSSAERMRITSGGALGIGTAAPAHPLHMGSGAHVTAGGVWTNASSRELKTDIEPLKNEEYSDILKKLEDLEVVHFKYKSEPDVAHIGMIAEDVPDEMASPDRKGIPTADAIAFLMAAVKAQQSQIEQLKATVKDLKEKQKE